MGIRRGVADGRAPYASGEDIPNDSTAQVRVSKLPGRKWPLSFASSIHTAWPAAGEKGGGVRVRAAPVLRTASLGDDRSIGDRGYLAPVGESPAIYPILSRRRG